MKKIIMTFSVLVDNEPLSACGQYSCEMEKITHCLYEHICAWEFNWHGTVEPTDEEIIDNNRNGLNTKKIIMTFSVFIDDDPLSDNEENLYNMDQIIQSMHEHISEWEFNVHQSVEIIHTEIMDNASIEND